MNALDLQRFYQQSNGPFYLYRAARFQEHYTAFEAALSVAYPKCGIAYSYKTNYLPCICRNVNEQGGFAEVVSEIEYDLACRIGVQPSDIIVNGPFQTESLIEKILRNGSILNLDSLDLARRVAALAQRNGLRDAKLGIRVNAMNPRATSRFGIRMDDARVEHLLTILSRVEGRQIVSLHLHQILPERSPEEYRAAAQYLISIYDRYFLNETIQMLNVGGGFFSDMPAELKAQFNVPVHPYSACAASVSEVFQHRFGDAGPTLVAEPGLALTADVMEYVTPITAIKTIGDRQFAMCDGNRYNISPSGSSRNLPVRRVGPAPVAGTKETYILTGNTCMENDVLHTAYKGCLAVGDFLIFSNVGAYTFGLVPPFIQQSPPIYSISETGEIQEQLKRPGGFDHIFSLYNLDKDSE